MASVLLAISPLLLVMVIVTGVTLHQHYKTKRAIKELAMGTARLAVPAIAAVLREFSQRVSDNRTEKGANRAFIKPTAKRQNHNG